MMTHEAIWQAIDRLAASSGFSTSGLATKAGLDPTAFNRSKRLAPDGRPRWPSTESIAKILAVTGATLSEFLSFVDTTTMTDQGASARALNAIPVLGYAQAGQDGYFDDAGYPVGSGWDYIQFPQDVVDKGETFYALEITGDSMQPLYREGDRLIVSPGTAIRRGDRVVVKTRGGEVMAKELARQTAARIELKSFNPAHQDRAIEMNEVSWIARILWVSQ